MTRGSTEVKRMTTLLISKIKYFKKFRESEIRSAEIVKFKLFEITLQKISVERSASYHPTLYPT